ncbi:hypothetical protein GDO86_007982 [Hymenochirus boettgeri]|nr:hypothetical protein GDO86_007982 [Hymenochirus boettgeri]
MLLAQGLLVHFLGRDWTWTDALSTFCSESESCSPNTSKMHTMQFEASLAENKVNIASVCQSALNDFSCDHSEIIHRKIISWFADCPLAFFGLHQLVKLGENSGKIAGDWYGPAVVSHLLRKAVDESSDPELHDITIYVAQDCTIYSGDVHDLQCINGLEKAILILVPVRLGGENTNTEYFQFVKGILSLEYCIGIIGGKPKQSYYFVGFQDDSLIYMDPHYCQSFVDVSIKDFPLESFHCPSPKKMSFKKMDPSCTIGFYCRTAKEFDKAEEELTKVLKSSTMQNYPLFTFVNGHAQDFDFVCTPVYDQDDLFTEDEKKRLKRFSTEEFVLL